MDKKLNFIFWGTPDVASETLEILKSSGYTPSLIITSPDRPQGRKMLMTPPPVKTWALENGIQYLQPEKIDQEFISKLSSFEFELSIVVAYGKILPLEVITHPKLGSINIHYSILPKYRGASPVESAILHGETETGVTIQQMEYKMDAGDVIALEKVDIGVDETAPILRERLIKVGGELLVKVLNDFTNFPRTKQNEAEATFCKKINKEDGLIDLTDDADKNYNKFRAYIHWPRTYFFHNEKRVIITDAALIEGKFVVKKVLPEGKKEITWEEYESSSISK